MNMAYVVAEFFLHKFTVDDLDFFFFAFDILDSIDTVADFSTIKLHFSTCDFK